MGGRDASESSPFDEAAARLLEAFILGSASSDGDHQVVMNELTRFVRRRFGSADPQEVASEAVARFFEYATVSGKTIINPASYLMRTTYNTAVELFDRDRTPAGGSKIGQSTSAPTESDVVVDRVSASADYAEALAAAVRRSRASGARDAVAIRVLATYRDLAADGRSPTTREVASGSGCSHTTVERVYAQMREFLGGDRSEWPIRR